MTPEWCLSQKFDYRGQPVACDVLGDGEPVVLVHGTPFSSYVWRSIARELARTRQVFLFDLLGYGQSEKRAGQDVSLGVQNELLASLLQHWELTQPDIIAHDFGGATALRAHLLNGCDYRRLLLFDAVAIRPWGSAFVQHVRQFEAAFAGMPDYLQRAVLQAYIRTAIARPVTEEELEPYVAPWLGPVGQSAFYRQIAQMDLRYTDEVQARYGEIRCPVMILWGTADAWLPLDRGHQLASMIPGSAFQAVEGAGHLVQEDAPEAIVSAAFRFLG
jgi:pimeloyl-ACP methyl ester carboxylesterase